MGSRRPVLAAFASLALFICGGAAWWAALDGMYATCGVLGLAGVWIGAVWAWPEAIVQVTAPPARPNALETAESELRVLANLLDQAPAPMLTLHVDGSVRAANRAARRLFATEDRLRDPPLALSEALSNGAGCDRRLTVDLGASAGPCTYAVSVTDFVGPRAARRLAVLLDIQPELQTAEAAALRELMRVLNHEIMNGLTPIASLAATAVDLLDDPDTARLAEAREAMATLARRSEGLSHFVAAYRTLAHVPPPVRRPVSLSTLLHETAYLFRVRWSGRDVVLQITCPSPDVICALDEELVARALANLLSNAAEAALSAGAEPATVALSGRADGTGVILTVSDNGDGVATADRTRIFEPFFTTKPTGAGIGLSLTRQIALGHGGDLRLVQDSQTKFDLRLN